jgi:hypothetical protein
MTRNHSYRRAAVLAAALHSWATTTSDNSPPIARLVVRQGPTWEHISTTNLTSDQITRIITVLRTDLIPDPSRPATAVQASAAVDQLLAEWRAEGRKVIRPEDFIEALPRIGRSREWLAHHLVHLADAGYLRETRRPGTYRL